MASPEPFGALPVAMTLRLAAQPFAPSAVRSEMSAWLTGLGWPPEQGADVVMAVNEAVTNAVEHAYPADEPGEVRVRAARVAEPAGERVLVEVADDGHWRAPPAERGYRRRGLQMMQACMDTVTIERRTDGTTVWLASTPVAPDG